MMQKTVLIIGASGGLGEIVTLHFLRHGWNVYAGCLNAHQQEQLERLAASAEREHGYDRHDQENVGHYVGHYGKLTTHAADLTSMAGAQAFVDAAAKPFDALLCLAGGIQAGKPVEDSGAFVEPMMRLNFHTAFYTIAAALPHFQQRQQGSIVTIVARAAERAERNKSAYAASKAAVVALTKSVAFENSHLGIRANCIVPSIINTAANRTWGTEEDIQRWVQPEELAATMLYLCSDEASGVNGSMLQMFGSVE